MKYQTTDKIQPESSFQDKPIKWRKFLFLFLSNWYWFLIIVFIAMSVAYIKTRYTLPKYSVSATLLLEESESSRDFLSEIRQVRRMRREIDLANEIAKLRSGSLHLSTVDSLGWKVFWTGYGWVARIRPIYSQLPYDIELCSTPNPWYEDRTFFIKQIDEHRLEFTDKQNIDTIVAMETWVDLDGMVFQISRTDSKIGHSSYSFTIYRRHTLTREYLNKLNYEIDENGTVITISSSGPVLQKEIDYINQLCNNYIYSGLEHKRLIAKNSLKFLEDQVRIIRDSLKTAERQLLSYRLNNSIIDLSREGQLAYDKLQKFYEQKTALKLKQNYFNYLKNYIETKKDPQTIIAPTLVDANDELLIDQVRKLQTLYEEREKLTFTAEADNPGIIQVNTAIQSARSKILEIINGLISNNELAWLQINTEEKLIEQELLQLPLSEQELLNIQRKYDLNNHFLTFLLQKRTEAGLQEAATVSNVKVLDYADIYNYELIGTKTSLRYLISLLAGLIIPASIILLKELLDTRIKDRDDILENTDIPILGIVAHDTTGENIPVFREPGSAFAESFRHIRTNFDYVLREPEEKVIMVASTISGEGKSYIAVNLAAIFAMKNRKVLLAGFDLRRPTFHKVFNIDNDSGISTYLSGMKEYDEIITKTEIDNLDVIIAGPIPPNPAELLETKRMGELIKNASQEYDYIVIDTPPIALVTDALLISKYAHTNVFVIRQNYSNKGVLEMINNLKDKNLKNLSILVNDIKESKAFGYRYYYGYGYGYGYSYQYNYRYGYNYYQDSSRNDL